VGPNVAEMEENMKPFKGISGPRQAHLCMPDRPGKGWPPTRHHHKVLNNYLYRDLSNLYRGLTNLKGPKILFFIAGILLLMGLFTIELITEGLEIKFFIAGSLLLKGSLY
jgi:hypothetical protein